MKQNKNMQKKSPCYVNKSSDIIPIENAPVAQWIEHRSSEPRVVGSNPSRRARN